MIKSYYNSSHFSSRLGNVTIVPTQENQNQRGPQMIVKKINSNQRYVVVNSSVATQPQQQQVTTINKIPSNVITTAQRGGPR